MSQPFGSGSTERLAVGARSRSPQTALEPSRVRDDGAFALAPGESTHMPLTTSELRGVMSGLSAVRTPFRAETHRQTPVRTVQAAMAPACGPEADSGCGVQASLDASLEMTVKQLAQALDQHPAGKLLVHQIRQICGTTKDNMTVLQSLVHYVNRPVTLPTEAMGGGVVSPDGLADPGSNGIVVRTSFGNTVARALTVLFPLLVSNPDGVGGDPTIILSVPDIDHNLLANLLVGDPHLQYLPVDGLRPMLGVLPVVDAPDPGTPSIAAASAPGVGVAVVPLAPSVGLVTDSTARLIADNTGVTVNGGVLDTTTAGKRVAVLRTSGNVTLDVSNEVVVVTGAHTVTLPASPVTGQRYTVRNIHLVAITVDRNGKNINGAASNYALPPAEAVELVYDPPANGWWATAKYDNGSGDVVGPSSATDNAIARFDGATGKLIQNSALLIGDSVFGAFVVQSADATFGGDSETINFRSGAAPAGGSGGVSIDVGSAFATPGSINIGVGNAESVTIGRNAKTTTVHGLLAASGMVAANRRLTSNLTIPSTYYSLVARFLEIAGGVTLEIASGADLEIT